MNIQKFMAPNTRAAMSKARLVFGENTLILSSKEVPGGVEITATADDSLPPLMSARRLSEGSTGSRPASGVLPPAPDSRDSTVQEDTETLAMSTLSFQDYVRERLAQKKAVAAGKSSIASEAAERKPVQSPDKLASRPVNHKPRPSHQSSIDNPSVQVLMQEIHSLRQLFAEKVDALAWIGQTRQSQGSIELMQMLFRAGYAPGMVRAIIDKLPVSPDVNREEALEHVVQELSRTIRTDAPAYSLLESSGIYAIVGADGVGKTTVTATLVNEFSRRYGASSVGLISWDAMQRAGNHDQLRQLTRDTGVVAHLARDKNTLDDLLSLLRNKQVVLIDTAGLASILGDEEQSALQSLPADAQKLQVLPAIVQADVLESWISKIKDPHAPQVILSHMDQAIRLGPLLSSLARLGANVRGLINGSDVEKNWVFPSAAALVRESLKSNGTPRWDPHPAEMEALFLYDKRHSV